MISDLTILPIESQATLAEDGWTYLPQSLKITNCVVTEFFVISCVHLTHGSFSHIIRGFDNDYLFEREKSFKDNLLKENGEAGHDATFFRLDLPVLTLMQCFNV